MTKQNYIEQLLKQILAGNMILPHNNETINMQQEDSIYDLSYQLALQAIEAYHFMDKLSKGNLRCSAPRNNVLLGAAKDLQSILRNILWSCNQIAQGDYTQTIDFMGDFSHGFSLFTKQVAMREEYQQKVAALEQEKLSEKNRVLNEQLKQQLAHYETINEMHKTIRGIKHDFKNHLFGLNELANRNDIEGIKSYLNGLSVELFTKGTSIYNTGNPIFDAMLTDKMNNAAQKDIDTKVELALSEKIAVSNMDWCVLLGNTLDNAVEACERLDGVKKSIAFEARSHGNMLNICIKNTSLASKFREDGSLCTAKENAEEHGMGLDNVKRILEKYDGVLQTHYSDGYFTLIMMLCGV